MHEWVLGLDPGKMTGWALLHVPTLDLSVSQADWYTACTEVDVRCASLGSNLAIACEAFLITQQTIRNTQALWSLHGIGQAMYCSIRSDCKFVLQTPAAAKQFGTDDRLKALGWYRPGLPHGVDAVRHVLLYLVKCGWWHEELDVPEVS